MTSIVEFELSRIEHEEEMRRRTKAWRNAPLIAGYLVEGLVEATIPVRFPSLDLTMDVPLRGEWTSGGELVMRVDIQAIFAALADRERSR